MEPGQSLRVAPRPRRIYPSSRSPGAAELSGRERNIHIVSSVPISIFNCHRSKPTRCESRNLGVHIFIVWYLMFCRGGSSLKCVRKKFQRLHRSCRLFVPGSRGGAGRGTHLLPPGASVRRPVLLRIKQCTLCIQIRILYTILNVLITNKTMNRVY